MQGSQPYAIKIQRKARNVPRAVSLWHKRAGVATPHDLNQWEHSIRMDQWEVSTLPGGNSRNGWSSPGASDDVSVLLNKTQLSNIMISHLRRTLFCTALETITIILTECSLQILLFIRNLKSFLLEKQNFPTFFIQFASNIFSCLVNFELENKRCCVPWWQYKWG